MLNASIMRGLCGLSTFLSKWSTTTFISEPSTGGWLALPSLSRLLSAQNLTDKKDANERKHTGKD
jgi:hypothetical protein